MKEYDFTQWILLFFLFSFLGWIFESTYVSLHEHKAVNRGFFRGPWIPLYGSGGVVMLFIALPFAWSAPLVFVVGLIGATALEYATGIVMERMFRVRYWDYTGKPLASKNGYISLPSSLCWGAFTMILTYVGAPWIDNWIFKLPRLLEDALAGTLSTLFIADAILSFRTAFSIRDIAVLLSKLSAEMEELHQKLPENLRNLPNLREAIETGVLRIENGKAILQAKKEAIGGRIENRLDAQLAFRGLSDASERLSAIKSGMSTDAIQSLYENADEIYAKNVEEAIKKYRELLQKREEVLCRMNWFVSQTLKGNPDASSALAGFEQMKKRVANRIPKLVKEVQEKVKAEESGK